MIITDSGHIILSAIQTETVAGRLSKDDDNILEADELEE